MNLYHHQECFIFFIYTYYMCTSSAYYEKATLDKIFYQKGVYGGVCLHDCMLFDNFFVWNVFDWRNVGVLMELADWAMYLMRSQLSMNVNQHDQRSSTVINA